MIQKDETAKLKQALTVAQLYYEDELSQAAIAKKLQMSRPTISRFLQLAKAEGLVKIQVENPFVDYQDLSEILSEKYQLKIQVVPEQYQEKKTMLDRLGAYTAAYLTKIVQPTDIIGIGWGKTIHAVTSQLEKQDVTGVQTVQLKGSFSFGEERTYAYESMNELAEAFNARAQYLPLPTFFDNQTTKELVEQDRFIRSILQLGRQANIALFTVGSVRKDALLFNLGHLDESQKKKLQEEAVGDVVSRFIDEEGQLVNQELDQRTVGIELTELKKKEYSILVAGGAKKAATVQAVLKAGYANQAIFDVSLAQHLIHYD
ncbi:RNA polymerase subunit sigma-70 [Tetragenococcus osmophilus]|uniref:RNA polymerase subunit sigma-70 n=1 Tax=Tetragenococcus osmophilus TaxID=526944 RepID=A0ABN5QTH0_9ENTE|nr:sugar-binding transcriptional regulator [Tetragenococcus osmophilus]AYW47220.1 RNA polymerase subunit sigma-70 [Tetragenococcus osmophilus]